MLSRSSSLVIAASLVVGVVSPAAAQRRTDFEAAVLGEAATATAPRECEEAGGTRGASRPIPRDLQAHMVGRAIRVASPEGDARTRRVGLVRVATERTDANGDLAYRLFAVLLAGSGRTWTPLAHTEIPLGDAPFDYEYEGDLVRIARTEDVDDDGEQELVVVIESDTEVECGTGYCSLRATAVLDVADHAMPLLVVTPTQLTCEAALDTVRGTTTFRDVDGDGHRDVVVRTQSCAAPEWDDAAGELAAPVCAPAVTTVRRWDAATDRYLPPAS